MNTVMPGAPTSLIGGLVGGWRISTELGEGGQHRVYACERDGIRAAIRVPNLDSADDALRTGGRAGTNATLGSRQLPAAELRRYAKRFRNMKVASRRSSYVEVPIEEGFDFDRELPYLVSELVEGALLMAALSATPPEEHDRFVLTIAAQLFHALRATHLAGVIHRDVKPGNILVARVGQGWRLVLIDFGISMNRETTGSLGPEPRRTPAYAAPERLSGSTPGTPASDVFEACKTLAELIASAQLSDVMQRALTAMTAAGLVTDPSARPAIGDLFTRALRLAPPGAVVDSTHSADRGAGANPWKRDADPAPTLTPPTPSARRGSTARPAVEASTPSPRDVANTFPGLRRRTALALGLVPLVLIAGLFFMRRPTAERPVISALPSVSSPTTSGATPVVQRPEGKVPGTGRPPASRESTEVATPRPTDIAEAAPNGSPSGAPGTAAVPATPGATLVQRPEGKVRETRRPPTSRASTEVATPRPTDVAEVAEVAPYGSPSGAPRTAAVPAIPCLLVRGVVLADGVVTLVRCPSRRDSSTH